MKKIYIVLFFLPFLFSCDGGVVNYNNPNVPNFQVNLQLNMSLPQYNNLQFAGNHVVDYSQGARGIVVFNAGNTFLAYDLACPNQAFNICTQAMTVNSVEVKCNCNSSENSYSLYTGQSQGQQYPMKPYHVQVGGGYLYVTN